jgi:trimeric autotransporter adhesin
MSGSPVQIIIQEAVTNSAAKQMVANTTANDFIVVFALDGTAANTTLTCQDDEDGSYGAAAFTVNDAVDGCTLSVFIHKVVTGGVKPTITVARTGSQVAFIAAQITGVTAADVAIGRLQTAPGNTADAISTGTTTTTGATDFAIAIGLEATGTSGAPAAGTGFTSATGTNIAAVTGITFGTAFNLARVEWESGIAAGTGKQATFTDATNGSSHDYDTLVVFLKEGGAAAALASAAADSSSATGNVTTGITPAAGASDTTTASGNLSTGVRLAGAASDTSIATGTIGGAALTGSGADTTSAGAALTTGIQAAAAAADSSAASGTLTNFASVVLTNPLYTGVGGILDPHFWAGGSTPGVGTTVLYDPTHIAIATNSEISSDINDCRGVVQFFDGTTWQVGLVIITPGMVAYADVSAAVTDALTTAIPLLSAGTNLGTITAALTAQITPASAAADVSTASGSLITAIRLLSTAVDTSTAGGTLPGGSAPMGATASDSSSASASLSTIIELADAATTVVSAAAALLTSIQMGVAATSISSATGTLGGAQATLVGNASDSSTSIAALSTQIQASGAATDLAISAGALSTAIRMVAGALDTTAATGSLATQIAGAAQSLSNAVAGLTTQIQFRGSSLATSVVSAALDSQIQLAATPANATQSVATLTDIPRVHFGWAVVTALSQTIQGARQAFIEQSACEVMAGFFATTGETYSPVNVRYRIDDVVSGKNILPWTSLPPASSEMINVSSSQNAMISLTRSHEAHQVMIEITDDFGSISFARAVFDLYRVPGVGAN